MRDWIFCFLQMIAYTVGVITACGLAIELCYRLCFLLLGRRGSRALWYATVPLGAPVHELGHAVMCLLFCHKIEKIRLLPTKAGNACVVHTYRKHNPYAAFGNLCISIGPLLSGLGVMFLAMYFIFPRALTDYLGAVELLLADGATLQLGERIFAFVLGLMTEQSSPVWLRLIGAYVLFSMALHLRLSTADLYEMRTGIPGVLILAALGATVAVAWGTSVRAAMITALREFSWIVIALFSVILLIALVQIALAALFRLVCVLLGIKIGG
ncbi:MAG: M50 family metallopeptidase [Clostridia bacterium]|nr:M50 family metallopeptidase [Clostridia bacterium]